MYIQSETLLLDTYVNVVFFFQFFGPKLCWYPLFIYSENQKQKIANIQKTFLNYRKLSSNLQFIYSSNYLILDSANFVPLPTNLFIFDSVNIIQTSLTLWFNISYRNLFSTFLPLLINKKCFYFLLLILWQALIPRSSWASCYCKHGDNVLRLYDTNFLFITSEAKRGY